MCQSTVKKLQAQAFIFDLDGTLVDTTPIVEAFWRRFALENDLDAEKILATSHGRRSIETIAEWVPHKATLAYAEACESGMAQETEGLCILPGVTALLEKIPFGRMGICTSSTEYMAQARLKQCNISVPTIMITADKVKKGKPDPEGYLTVARGLGIDPKDCIVFEDAPAGVKAAKNAGMQCVGCLTSHTAEKLKEAGVDYIVPLLSEVNIESMADGGFEVILTNTQ